MNFAERWLVAGQWACSRLCSRLTMTQGARQRWGDQFKVLVILACGCKIPSENIFAVAFITRLYVQESYEALPVEQKVSFILLKHLERHLTLKKATILFVEVKHAWMSINLFGSVVWAVRKNWSPGQSAAGGYWQPGRDPRRGPQLGRRHAEEAFQLRV